MRSLGSGEEDEEIKLPRGLQEREVLEERIRKREEEETLAQPQPIGCNGEREENEEEESLGWVL